MPPVAPAMTTCLCCRVSMVRGPKAPTRGDCSAARAWHLAAVNAPRHPAAVALAALLAACGGADAPPPPPACRAGEPEPVFAGDEPWLTRHAFERAGQRSREAVATATDSFVLEQGGCDTLVQQFEFAVDDSVATWPQFRRDAADRLNAWSRTDERYFRFAQYANALTSVPPEFPLGRPADLAPGLTLRAYPLPTDSPRRWILRLEQDLTGATR